MSTFDSFSLSEGEGDTSRKMKVISNYNNYAKGVDRLNQLCGYYRYNHGTKKWWKPIFYQFLEIVMVNSYILYKNGSPNNKLTFKDFRTEVAKDLYAKNFSETIKIRRKTLVVHNQIHLANKWAKVCKCCHLKKSCYKCAECSIIYNKEIALCRENCFAQFHLDPNKYLARKKSQRQEQGNNIIEGEGNSGVQEQIEIEGVLETQISDMIIE